MEFKPYTTSTVELAIAAMSLDSQTEYLKLNGWNYSCFSAKPK